MAIIKIKNIKSNLQPVIAYGKNGDKYQVVICTHVNKQNVHNHIILNSVSFLDGKKYHNSETNIAFTREVSDRLCLENGLSIVNTSKSNK